LLEIQSPIAFERAQQMYNHQVTRSEVAAPPQGWRVAVLALIAGYVDSYGFLSYKVYASFMSGNTTQAGLQTGQEKLAEAGLDLLPIPLFVAGVFAGALLVHSSLRHRLSWLLGLVAALLAIAMAALNPATLPDWLGIVILSLAMGILNTTLTRVGEQTVSLGYVTGTLNNLAQHLALAVKRLPVPHAQGSRDTHGRRAVLLAGIWTAFLIGALLAGAATPRFGAWALLPPILTLVVLAAFGRALDADPGAGPWSSAAKLPG
jgi:uncharacterized membrane protein YoaK (UPF0700 family)